jgi:hypothetical protein
VLEMFHNYCSKRTILIIKCHTIICYSYIREIILPDSIDTTSHRHFVYTRHQDSHWFNVVSIHRTPTSVIPNMIAVPESDTVAIRKFIPLHTFVKE